MLVAEESCRRGEIGDVSHLLCFPVRKTLYIIRRIIIPESECTDNFQRILSRTCREKFSRFWESISLDSKSINSLTKVQSSSIASRSMKCRARSWDRIARGEFSFTRSFIHSFGQAKLGLTWLQTAVRAKPICALRYHTV